MCVVQFTWQEKFDRKKQPKIFQIYDLTMSACVFSAFQIYDDQP